MSGIREYLAPLRGNLLVLISSMIVWNFVLQMVSTYEPLYVFALGGTGAALGLLTASQTLLSTFLRVPGGYIADKRGRRKIIGVVTIISSLGYVFYVFARDWTWLLMGGFVLAVIGLCEPAVEAIKADSVRPEERGRGYALLNTIPQIPAMLAPAVGGILIADGASGINLPGMRIAYLLLLAGVAVAGLIRLFFLRDMYGPEEEGGKLGLGVFRDVYETIVSSPSSTKRLLLLSGFFMFCFHMDVRVRPVFACDFRGLSTVEWGAVVSASLLISTLAVFVIGWLVDRYGRKRVFLPSVALLALGSLTFAVSDSFPMFLLAMVLEAVGLRGRIVAFQVLIADTVPISVRGRVMGAINVLVSLGSSTAIMISGLLYDVNPVLPFYASALTFSMAALVATKFLHEPETRQI
jgi:MFS family permease